MYTLHYQANETKYSLIHRTEVESIVLQYFMIDLPLCAKHKITDSALRIQTLHFNTGFNAYSENVLYQDKPLEMYHLIFKGVPNKHSQNKWKNKTVQNTRHNNS